MLRIATTVGTSLLENFRETGGPAFNNFLIRIEERPASDYNSFKGEIEQHLKSLSEFIKRDPGSACAEVKSCNLIRQKYDKDTTVYLIATDTLVSVLAAEAIDRYFNSLRSVSGKFLSVFIRDDAKHVIPSLQVNDKSAFEETGLQNLMGSLYYFLVEGIDRKNPGIRIINVTGGFKGVIPYMTIFAQLKGFPVNYVFESTENLIEIPPLPVGFESAFAEKYGYMLFNRKSLEEEAKEELAELGLIDSSNQPTALANLLTDYEVETLPTSINILGLVIEYKLMEYYISNPFPGYSNVERGNLWLAGDRRDDPPKGAEIDLVLKKSKQEINSTPFIAIECKSAKMLHTKPEKVREQLKKKLKLLQFKAVSPDEIHFMLYVFPEKNISIDKVVNRVDRKALGLIQQTVNEFLPGKTTRFYMAKFDLRRAYSLDNPYQSFVNEKLVLNKNFKEIILESKNV